MCAPPIELIAAMDIIGTMLSKNAALPPEVHTVLRAYMDAIVLAEPLQLKVWKTARTTLTQLRVLRVLREGDRSASELAERVGVSAPSLTRVLDRLEERGLLVRVADQSDRRRISIRILPEGQNLLGSQSIWLGTAFVQAVENMSQAERDEFVRAVRGFVSHVLSAHETGGDGNASGGQS